MGLAWQCHGGHGGWRRSTGNANMERKGEIWAPGHSKVWMSARGAVKDPAKEIEQGHLVT